MSGILSRHLSDTDGNGLTLGSDEDDLLVYIADGVDGAVLHNHTFGASEERLEGRDDSVDRRPGCSPERTAELLHVIADTKEETKVDTEGTDVSTGLARNEKLLHVTADIEEEIKVDTEGPIVSTGLARNAKDGKPALVVELEDLAGVDGADTEQPPRSLDRQERAMPFFSCMALERTAELQVACPRAAVRECCRSKADGLVGGVRLDFLETLVKFAELAVVPGVACDGASSVEVFRSLAAALAAELKTDTAASLSIEEAEKGGALHFVPTQISKELILGAQVVEEFWCHRFVKNSAWKRIHYGEVRHR
ncbi:hypothetical protein MBLNU13_g01803t1 [Cladosporium sp. NU13]